MLKTRVIPVLLTDGTFVIRPKYFERPGRNVGTLMQFVKNYNSRNIDEIIVLLAFAREKDHILTTYKDKIQAFTGELFCPCTIGGNVNTLKDIEFLLRSGADKVSINTAATDYHFVKEAVQKFGSQCIVASIDSKRRNTSGKGRKHVNHIHHYLYTRSGTLDVGIYAVDYAQHLEDIGVGEILLTSIDRDGSRLGYDKLLINEVTRAVKIPVIANGGCQGFRDMKDALDNGAHACAASSLFLFSPITPANCSMYLENNGYATRVEQNDR